MRKRWEIERDLYGYIVPYVKTITMDHGVTENIEDTMKLQFRDTQNPEEINYIVCPSFGGNDSFKIVDRFVFDTQFNYCEYEQDGKDGEKVYVPGGYIDFAVYVVCGNKMFQVEHVRTRNRAKRLAHKLNRALAEGKRVFKLEHDGKFTAF